MKVLVTGARGFIGQNLVRTLTALPALRDANDTEFAPTEIVTTDREGEARRDARVRFCPGDIADPRFVRQLIDADTGLVFHLAGVLSGAADADFGLGMRVNIDGTRNVLEAIRALGAPVRLVFASSIGVFGVPLPEAIDDDTPPRPALSYGAQKLVCETLLDDYTRRNYVDARSLRLPGIVVRPRSPSGALSAFNSDLIREPLEGRDYTCPVGLDAVLWIQSVERCVKNLLHAAMLANAVLGGRRTLNLPCVVASIAEIVDAIGRIAGGEAAARVRVAPDAALQAQFGSWPRKFSAARAKALGFESDSNLTDIIRRYVEARPQEESQ